MAAVISSTPTLFNAIKYAGAAYLFWLGLQTISAVFKPTVETSEEKTSSNAARRIIGCGILVTLLNPKMFYISFFAQCINAQAENAWMAFIILAAVMFAITPIYFSFLIFCGSYLLSRLKGNRRLSAIANALVGVFFIGLQYDSQAQLHNATAKPP